MLTSAAAIAMVPGHAFAQATDDSGGLNEIIVTARRAAESVQDTPVSITAFSGEDLAKAGANQITDLARSTPGLNAQPTATSPMGLAITLRGQIVTDTAAGAGGSVGVYTDDVFQGASSIVGGLFNLDDLERVEILKGPQGTLYGRNVTGGVVKFVTNRPDTEKVEGYVKAGYGNYDRMHASGMVNVPLAEGQVAARINASYDRHDGYSHDVLNDRDLDNLKRYSLRGQLLVKPSDTVEVLLQGWYGKGSSNGPDVRMTYLAPGLNPAAMQIIAYKRINGLNAGNFAPIIFGAAAGFTPEQIGAAVTAASAALPGAQAFVASELNAPRSRAAQNPDPEFQQFIKSKAYGGDLVASIELGDATIKSITAYTFGQSDRGFNVGGGSVLPIFTNQFGENSQWSQEIQLNGTTLEGRLTYALGGFYLNSKIKDIRNISSRGGFTPFLLGQRGLGVLNGNIVNGILKVRSTAFYGQATYDITDTVHFTGGLRYTDETSSVRTDGFSLPSVSTGGRTLCAAPAPSTAATPFDQCFAKGSSSSTNWSYTAGLNWDVTQDIMVYAKTSRGFKAGGINQFTTAFAPIEPFGPEENTDYEVGFKAEFLDRRARVNVSYYHTDYKGIQRTISKSLGAGLISTFTQNAASAKIDGIEADAEFVVTDGLRLFGSFAYTDPRYKKYLVPYSGLVTEIQDRSGLPFQSQAKYTYSLGASYDVTVGPADLSARVNWSHRSSTVLFENDILPSKPGGTDFAPISTLTQKAYGLLDASLSAKFDSITLTLWGKNVLNKKYYASIISLVNNGVGAGWGNYGEPATVGADIKFAF
jgi:iron complex outermembrane receptor protein